MPAIIARDSFLCIFRTVCVNHGMTAEVRAAAEGVLEATCRNTLCSSTLGAEELWIVE